MTGEQGNETVCAFCGGRAAEGLATVPFVLGKSVVVMRDVPALVCEECGEPFMTGRTTDAITAILARLASLGTEVSVISYADAEDSALLAIE